MTAKLLIKRLLFVWSNLIILGSFNIVHAASIANAFLNQNYNSIWGGANFVVPINTKNKDLDTYRVGYEFGVAAGFYNDGQNMMYAGSIVDITPSTHGVEANKPKYDYFDAALVLGYEHVYGADFLPQRSRFLSFFIELGPGGGFISQTNNPEDCIICSASGYSFNFLTNLGLYLNLMPRKDKLTILLRLAGRFQIGTSVTGNDKNCHDTIKINAIHFYVPSLSVVLRWK